jgi:hypothetical protein
MFLGCMGGTGTDTDNGVAESGWHIRMEDGEGAPMPGVLLAAFSTSYLAEPGPGQGVVETGQTWDSTSSVWDAAIVGATSEVGWARLRFLSPGTYRVEAMGQDGSSLGFTTLAVEDTGRSDTLQFSRQGLRTIRGKIDLASGLILDSGRVYFSGTRHAAKVNGQGLFDLGTLAEGISAWPLELSYRARSSVVREITLESTLRKDSMPGLAVPMDTPEGCTDPALAEWSSAPGGARCIDSEAGEIVVVKGDGLASEDLTFVTTGQPDSTVNISTDLKLNLVPAECVDGLTETTVTEFSLSDVDTETDLVWNVADIDTDCP